ncbi:SMP-30/gluconolactonase/LRE family protein [Croceivirga sp. JEA036]|uniref:SMP-30/gluconolactonase/LRE family protein n=1 Tax=Croceivirga sp. JEA036 TaxID=2721162 RepID=UPI00143AA48A|nr:SMP-30/gluconolactonase/LRE family protein [Croceivirga sp. JEA036]NJB35220.1 SMP-30/gluconolactonase/LRE family protein [Croceivirga sp. JEA036]
MRPTKPITVILGLLLLILGSNCKPKKEKETPIPDSKAPTTYTTIGEVIRLDDKLDEIIATDAKIEVLAEGFNWSEGPVWNAANQTLYFSDVPENKLYQWSAKDGVSVYISPSGYTGKNLEITKGSNGLTFNKENELILCQVGDKRVSKFLGFNDEGFALFQTLAGEYQGKPFNSPNDLVYDSRGNLYFTDPTFGFGKEASEIGFSGVYRLTTDGEVVLLVEDIPFPNGIALSPDEKILYVADSNPELAMIWQFAVDARGRLGAKEPFFDATQLFINSTVKQLPDGIKVDAKGNLFVAGPDGVLVLDHKGKHLGTLATTKVTGNCALAVAEKYLYITADDALLRIALL